MRGAARACPLIARVASVGWQRRCSPQSIHDQCSAFHRSPGWHRQYRTPNVPLKSVSRNLGPSSSRNRIGRPLRGNAARATSAVCSGTSGHGTGRNDVAPAPTRPRPPQQQLSLPQGHDQPQEPRQLTTGVPQDPEAAGMALARRVRGRLPSPGSRRNQIIRSPTERGNLTPPHEDPRGRRRGTVNPHHRLTAPSDTRVRHRATNIKSL